MLAAGQIDAIAGFSFSTYVNVKHRGVPVDDLTTLLMADHGLLLYGNAVIANAAFAAEKPEAVKGFLRAFLKGLRDTVKDPAAAIEAVMKRNDFARREVELERLLMALDGHILTPEVKKNGYGGVDAARLEQAIDQIALIHNFRTKPKPGDVFDASFLPAEKDRKVE
jgi:NitT/TauT family transport system substrate-binding protein